MPAWWAGVGRVRGGRWASGPAQGAPPLPLPPTVLRAQASARLLPSPLHLLPPLPFQWDPDSPLGVRGGPPSGEIVPGSAPPRSQPVPLVAHPHDQTATQAGWLRGDGGGWWAEGAPGEWGAPAVVPPKPPACLPGLPAAPLPVPRLPPPPTPPAVLRLPLRLRLYFPQGVTLRWDVLKGVFFLSFFLGAAEEWGELCYSHPAW